MSPRNKERLEAKLLAMSWMDKLSSDDQAAIVGGDPSSATPPLLTDQTLNGTTTAIASVACLSEGGASTGG